MDRGYLITKEQFCELNNIEIHFIDSLSDLGLVEIIIKENQPYLQEEQLKAIETFTHLHYDLDINLEGIDAIAHLLQRLNDLRDQTIQLQNRLRIYEDF